MKKNFTKNCYASLFSRSIGLRTLFFGFFLLLSLNVFSQQVTLKVKEAKPEYVFRQISKQTDYQFLYAKEQIARMKPITIDVKNEGLVSVLDQIFTNQNFTYTISGRIIALKARTVVTERDGSMDILVQGVVLDDENKPMPNVSVIEKGTALGRATNVNGEFAILMTPNGTLSFSHVGFETQEKSFSSAKKVKIYLSPAENALKNVVVTGIYTRPRESFTGAVSTITAKELKQYAPQNPLIALQILDPAFQVIADYNQGSNPNAVPEVRLRGQNNFPVQSPRSTNSTLNALYGNNPNQPLFIMDGFEIPLQTLLDMDMNRIARITLLKDASATAIYGSRGSNGVVVIETVQPKPGEIQINYTANLGLNTPDLTSYNLLNARDKLYLEKIAGVYDVTGVREEDRLSVTDIYNTNLKEVERGVNTYWLSQPLRNAISQSHTLGVYGGEQAMRYSISLNYKNTQGVMIGNNRNNYSGTLGLNYIKGKLSINNNVTFGFNKANESPYGRFSSYTRLNPYLRPYGPDGKPVRTLMDYSVGYDDNYYGVENPLYTASQNPVNYSTYNQLIENLQLNYRPLPWLRLTGTGSFTYTNDESNNFRPNTLPEFDALPFGQRGRYALSNGKSYNAQGSLSFDINKTWDKHSLYLTTNGQIIESSNQSYRQTAIGFTNSRVNNFIFGNQYAISSRPNGSQGVLRSLSMNNFLTYTYDSRYYTNFSYTRTGSSQFGSKQRFGSFWSIGAGWNLHQEKFLKDNTVLNTLRLRASMGPTGNQNFAPYQGVTTYRYASGANYRGLLGAQLLGYGNEDLKWQTNFKKNIGIDVNLYSNRINFAADYYVDNTKDLILGLNTPPSAGFSSFTANRGRMQNKGLEMRLNVGVIRDLEKNINWNVGITATTIRNKILEIYPIPINDNPTDQQLRDNSRYVVGGSINDVWVIPSAGVDPANGQELFLMPDGNYTYFPLPEYQIPLGNSLPKWQGSINTSFQYKGFTLSVGSLFRRGARILNKTLQERVEVVTYRDNVDRRVLTERWIKPGDVTRFTSISPPLEIGKPPETYSFSSRLLQLENVLDIQSISLAYRLPEKLMKKLRLSNTSITAFSNSPFYISTIRQERGLYNPFQRVYSLQISTTIF